MHIRFLNLLAAAAVSATLVAAVGTATAADPVDQVKAREALMKKMGGGMKVIGQFVKGEGGTQDEVQKAAAAIAEVSANDVAAVFPQGTAKGVGDSHAKPELWAQWSKTQQLWSDMRPAAAKLVDAAKAGDKAQVAQAMQATGKTCANCHEEFRIKKQ
ncbi:cytochrome c [Azospirillum sp.]|uniref:c-type cytochrome n=1 Tax=Azospirillum sp. TaxID=34012 RepID=UPI002D633682|nr:cytochrome c [Azospirillum sp.]HYD64503.1 cytochrome c [Azospirillum sp.]